MTGMSASAWALTSRSGRSPPAVRCIHTDARRQLNRRPTAQQETIMGLRSQCSLWASPVVFLFPAVLQAQVIPFGQNFGSGLSSSDNQMVFESAARVNAAEPGKVGQSDSWRNPQTKSHGSSTITRGFTSG